MAIRLTLSSLIGVLLLPIGICPSAAARTPTVQVNLNNYQGFINTPVPAYPKEALEKNWGGAGLFQLYFDKAGSVKKVEVMISTDNQLLDHTAVGELNQWKCHPGAVSSAMITMIFRTHKSDKPVDLGKDPGEKNKGNFLSAPHPLYPLAARRLGLAGCGLFMLHFQDDGKCDKAVPVYWIGRAGEILAHECVSTFLNWRCVPGKYHLILVPISFTLNGRFRP
jgi:hypothetical protein